MLRTILVGTGSLRERVLLGLVSQVGRKWRFRVRGLGFRVQGSDWLLVFCGSSIRVPKWFQKGCIGISPGLGVKVERTSIVTVASQPLLPPKFDREFALSTVSSSTFWTLITDSNARNDGTCVTLVTQILNPKPLSLLGSSYH